MPKPNKLRLIHDVLDKLMVDRNELPVGRVDGIILVLRGEQSQPRVAQIESGGATLARRLSSGGARWLHWLMRRVGLRWKKPARLDWSKIEDVGKEVKLDLDGEHSRLLSGERWLRDHVVRHIPGNGMQKTEK